jgi:hypothetical protein
MPVEIVASEGLLILKFEFENEARKDVVEAKESKKEISNFDFIRQLGRGRFLNWGKLIKIMGKRNPF